MQGNVAPLKNRAGANGEIFKAGVAAVKATFPGADPLRFATMGALHAFGPQPGLKIYPGRFLVGKHLEKLKCANRYLIHNSIIIIYFRESSI
jgi:hypothetical protein